MGKNFCIELTNEEKRETIQSYCDRRNSCISGQYPCPLFNLPQERGGCVDCKVEYLDEHFRLISEMPDFFEALIEYDKHDKYVDCENFTVDNNDVEKVQDLNSDKMMGGTNKYKSACGMLYNIEWYLGNGKLRTTSAMLENIEGGYFYFIYPNGGLLIVEQGAIRSLECGE